MKKKLLTKSAAVLTSAIIAGNALAFGTDGSVLATLSNNENIISESVLAAEVAPAWSTALVYAGFNPDMTSGFTWQNAGAVGSTWHLLNKPGWNFVVSNTVATTGEVISYQNMQPSGLLTKAGPKQGGYVYSDDAYTTMFDIADCTKYKFKDIWNMSREEFVNWTTGTYCQNVGTLYYDTIDEGTFYRITYNCTSVNSKGEIMYGYETAIQVKATGKIYFARFCQTQPIYNDIIARTMVYSFMPTVLQ